MPIVMLRKKVLFYGVKMKRVLIKLSRNLPNVGQKRDIPTATPILTFVVVLQNY